PEGAQAADEKKPKKDRKENTVYALAPDGALRRIDVEVGIRDNQHAEVLHGDVHEGDEIVTGQRREGTPEAEASGQRAPGCLGLKWLWLPACGRSSSSATCGRSITWATSRCGRCAASSWRSGAASCWRSWALRAPASRRA